MSNEGHKKFGEKRPRPEQLVPLQVKQACDCPEHLMTAFLIEMETVTNPMQALAAVLEDKQPEFSKQWVPIAHVLLGYN